MARVHTPPVRTAHRTHRRLRDDLSMATTTSGTGPGLRGRFWLQGTPEGRSDPPVAYSWGLGLNPLLELDEVLTPMTRETSRRKLPDGSEGVTSSFGFPRRSSSGSHLPSMASSRPESS